MWKRHCGNVKRMILRFLAVGFTCSHMEPEFCKKYSAYCVYTLLASLYLPLEPAAASCFTTCWERLSGQFRENVGWFCAEMRLLVCLHNHGFASWPRNPQREQPFELIWNARSCVSTISISILPFFFLSLVQLLLFPYGRQVRMDLAAFVFAFNLGESGLSLIVV